MADENSEQAIPPKVVPPQIRILGAAAGSAESPTVRAQAVSSAGVPAPVPRTVRLKPIGAAPAGGIPAASSGPGLSPAAQSDAAVAGAAVDAVKRMTARIAVLSGEADAGKKRTGHLVSGDSGAKKATAAIAPISVMDSETTVKKVTSRIQMSATVAIPELSDTPKTIKIKPLSGTQPVGGTQPVPLVEPPAVVGQTAAQIAAGKSKTSRIPLESAMSMPQAGGASTSDPSGGAPKTIKLKRPGEMSTIKVSVPGASPSATSTSAAAAGGQPPDNSSITQKKTIRVKRPSSPAAASMAEGGAGGEPGALSPAGMSPVAFAPAAPERGTGWFIALAVACILIAIGVAGVFFVQLYGSAPNTQLDAQYQKG